MAPTVGVGVAGGQKCKKCQNQKPSKLVETLFYSFIAPISPIVQGASDHMILYKTLKNGTIAFRICLEYFIIDII